MDSEMLIQTASTTDLAREKGVNKVFEGIQALRFAAALLVVVTHSTLYCHERLDQRFNIWYGGTVGVDIFFVISGFVMYSSSAYLANQSFGWREFSIRRLIRIVPPYWFATSIKLIILLLTAGLVLHARYDFSYILKSYFFIPAFNDEGRVEPLLGVGWTLLFEMFFYLIFALSLAITKKILVPLSIILSLCAGLSFFRQPDWPATTVYSSPLVLEFLAGIFIATPEVLLKLTPKIGIVSFIFGTTLYILCQLFKPGIIPAFVAREIPSAFIVLGIVALEDRLKSANLLKVFIFLGTSSYSLYLIHPIVAPISPEIFHKLNINSPIFAVLASILLAIGAGICQFKLLEAPVIKILTKMARPLMGSKRPILPPT